MQESENIFSESANIKERIVYFIEKQRIKKTEFFDKIGISSANFRGKAKDSPLNSTTIENIITHYPDINLYWLMTGKGSMIENKMFQPIDEPMQMPREMAALTFARREIALQEETIKGLKETIDSQKETIILQRERIALLQKEVQLKEH